MLENVVAVTAGKGGVLKTSLACHLSGIAAASGWRVLLVDADPQGNAMFDLGYHSDGGDGLATALVDRTPLRPLEDVRPNLDVVCGGPRLDDAARQFSDVTEDWYALQDTLASSTERYDLVVIDSPARELWIRHMILTAARFLIIPSGIDRASRVGLPDAAATVNEVRAATNPELDVLAVTAGPIAITSTRIRQRARQRLGDLIGDHGLVCDTIIRHAPLVAEQCRELGLLTHEYARLSTSASNRHNNTTAPVLDPATISGSARGVAADWSNLTSEILTRYRTAVQPPQRGATPPTAALTR